MSKAASLLRPYNFSVWIPVLLALVISGPVLWFVAGKSRKTNLKQPLSLWHSYRINFLIIISQGDTSFERIILVFVNPTDLFNNNIFFVQKPVIFQEVLPSAVFLSFGVFLQSSFTVVNMRRKNYNRQPDLKTT